MVIAIDGPSGSGKSTLAVALANRLNIKFFNTGMIFRAVAYCLENKNFSCASVEHIENFIQNLEFEVVFEGNNQYIFYEGTNITEFLFTPQVAQNASIVSQNIKVRKFVSDLQHKYSKIYDLVIEGRDIGTEVFPDAEHKFFITASMEARVERRYADLVKKNPDITKQEIELSIKTRDYNDMNRKISPLKKADDAKVVDTTNNTVEQCVNYMASFII